MIRLPLTLLALVTATSACDSDFALQSTEIETVGAGNLGIIVSNQSFEIDAVDVHVRIDGKVAISDVFLVEGQHTFIDYTFDIRPGLHQLSVTTAAGEAQLEAQIETTTSKRWATIMYWYYPTETGGAGPTPRQFTFNESDDEPAFE